MKIGNPADTPSVAPATTGRTGASETAKTTPAAAPAEASAQVELSNTAASLISGVGGEFDAAKVERISQAIAKGEFTVNAEVIADKLIANAQELLGKTSH
mgnify:CR=1 FL=1